MSNICFFDCETTGLPKNWRAPMSDIDNWPRVIQLAWQVTDPQENVLTAGSYLIKPDGWVIPVEKFWIDHGYNTEKSLEEGRPMQEIAELFMAAMQSCEYLVSHNMDFDHNVVGAEMLRLGLRGKRLQKICTKEVSTQYCAIPFEGQRAYMSKKDGRYKWPKLSELHMKLFREDFQDAHDAGGDVAALKKCFFELVTRGVIRINFEAA